MDNNVYAQQQANTYGYTNAGPSQPAKNNNKLFLIIIIIMAVVILVESIIVVITLTNYFKVFGVEDYEVSIEEEADTDTLYKYDNDGNISAINATCTDKNGTSYNMTKENTYEKTINGVLDSSGSYTVTNDVYVDYKPSSGDSSSTLYYNELTLSDEENIYECEENGLFDDES